MSIVLTDPLEASDLIGAPDPNRCPNCGQSKLVDRKMFGGWIRRLCDQCGHEVSRTRRQN